MIDAKSIIVPTVMVDIRDASTVMMNEEIYLQ